MAPRLMVCGHWEYWYTRVQIKVIKFKDMIDFGPGCHACFNKQPKAVTELELREKMGCDEELYDPTKDT